MFSTNIYQTATNNTNFRQVLQTGHHSQLVVMCLQPGEDIGSETHATADQLLFFVAGQATVTVGGDTKQVGEYDVVVVPAGTEHNVVNAGSGQLKLFTVYAPPTHVDGTIHATKAAAMAAEKAE